MKSHRSLLVGVLLAASLVPTHAQNALDLLDAVNRQRLAVSSSFLSYVSAVSHGKSARRVEKRRETLMNTVLDAKNELRQMGGDLALRQSAAQYLDLCQKVLKEDYGNIVNLEEIAERSYDDMEAYLMAQDAASEKLQDANGTFNERVRDFARRNNITLTEGDDDISRKMAAFNRVNEYYTRVYLVFFKLNNQESYLVKAMSEGNLGAFEQNRNTLRQYAEESRAKLDAVGPFDDDTSLLNACRNTVDFYQAESTDQTAGFADFLLKKEAFLKAKKDMESKPKAKITQADVDGYNGLVKEMNQLSDQANATSQQLNKSREKAVNGWNSAAQRFLDKFMPHHK